HLDGYQSSVGTHAAGRADLLIDPQFPFQVSIINRKTTGGAPLSLSLPTRPDVVKDNRMAIKSPMVERGIGDGAGFLAVQQFNDAVAGSEQRAAEAMQVSRRAVYGSSRHHFAGFKIDS